MQRSNVSAGPELLQWLTNVLGEESMKLLANQMQLALSLAQGKAEGDGHLMPSRQVLDAWADVLRAAERDTLQAKIAFVDMARSASLSDAEIATHLGVDEGDFGAYEADLRHQLIATYPGVGRPGR